MGFGATVDSKQGGFVEGIGRTVEHDVPAAQSDDPVGKTPGQTHLVEADNGAA